MQSGRNNRDELSAKPGSADPLLASQVTIIVGSMINL